MDGFTRRNPFMELDDLQNRLATLFGRAPVRKEVGKEDAMTVAEWPPGALRRGRQGVPPQGRVA